MKPLKANYEVEINNVKVDNRYYSFDFKVTLNGKLIKESSYESDHAWYDDIPGFRGHLKSNEAFKIALEQSF